MGFRGEPPQLVPILRAQASTGTHSNTRILESPPHLLHYRSRSRDNQLITYNTAIGKNPGYPKIIFRGRRLRWGRGFPLKLCLGKEGDGHDGEAVEEGWRLCAGHCRVAVQAEYDQEA